ncbi:MAG: hypothetical protein KBS82_07055 [Oscillospiraceae bacterium]|nr:hypothetical protein [Candidatus Limimonas egerieequi]
MSDSDLYIDRCKAFIDFMLSQRQWSGISDENINSWLSNFKGLKLEERRLVYKLLTNIIYFSENDVTEALKIGVFNCLSYSDILEKQKSSNFSLSNNALNNIHKTNINNACFVPLLDSQAPHESANSICRVLVQQGIIPAEKSMFLNQVPTLFQSGQVNNLIIVDDCVGSGQQLRTFWEETKIEDNGMQITIKELCEKYSAKANYLTLFGYEKSINQLRSEFPDLNIHCVRELSNQLRVFSESSFIWDNPEERKKAFELFDSFAKDAGIPIYGYDNLDFAFIMHKTIPDWSLPIFWKENSDWKLLLRRKNSND